MVLNHNTRNKFIHVIKVVNLADTSSCEDFLEVQIVEHNEIFYPIVMLNILWVDIIV